MPNLKLNLGAGGWDTQKEGFLSVDLNASADLVHDVSKPFPYDDSSITEIYASHIIEHLSRQEWAEALPEWFRLLAPKGKIEIYCPDLEACLQKYLVEPENHNWWIKTIYGSQSGPGQFHYNGFTLHKLVSDLQGVGLKIIKQEKITGEHLHVIAIK